MSDNKFREKMGKLIEENLEVICGDEYAHPGEAEKVLRDFRTKIKRKRKKILNRIMKRTALVACMVAAIFVTSMIFMDSPEVKAFSKGFKNVVLSSMQHVSKDESGSTIMEFTDMQTAEIACGELPFKIGYVPKGYELNRIQVKDDIATGARIFCFEYFNTKEMPIGHLSITAFEITDRDYLMTNAYNTLSATYYTETVRGTTVAFILGPPNTAVYNFRNLYEVSITSQLNEKEVIKIIRNII